jgi:regulator of nucleoside diphosphate kinase
MDEVMNTPPALVVSSVDYFRIYELMVRAKEKRTPGLDLLNKKLEKANIVRPEEVPSNVVTMNSQVMFLQTDTHDEYGFTLVYPASDTRPGDVSVLTPVGAALFGLSVGQEVHWWGRNGRRLGLRILTIVYQPEANGEYSL